MAEEFVRIVQFGEFVKRMEEGFVRVNELADQRYDSINQRLADAKRRGIRTRSTSINASMT